MLKVYTFTKLIDIIYSYLVCFSFMMDDDNSLQQKIMKKAFEGIQKMSAKFFSR